MSTSAEQFQTVYQDCTKFIGESDANHSIFNHVMDCHSQAVIEQFGEWSTIIELCLSNPNVSQYLTSEQLKSFCKILHENNIIQDLHCVTQTAVGDADGSVDDVGIINAIINHPNRNSNQQATINVNKKMNHNQLIVSSVDDFHTSKMIIECDRKNCILLQLFGSQNKFGLHTYSVFNTRLFSLIMITVSGLLTLIGDILYAINNNVYIHLIGILMSTVYALCLLSIGNLMIMQLTISTFDFWYKLTNYLMLILARVMEITNNQNSTLPLRVSIVKWTSIIIIYFIIFITDAIPMPTTIKQFFLFGFGCYVIGDVIYSYFADEDVTVNPFESYDNIGKYTQISTKSVRISSLVNLGVFVLKPLYGQVFRFFKKKLCCTGKRGINTNIDSNSIKHERLNCLYKRPHVEWNKI